MLFRTVLLASLLVVAGCVAGDALSAEKQVSEDAQLAAAQNTSESENLSAKNLSSAYFAGGCFWCMEPPFEALSGVSEVISGYSGGDVEDPSYEQVSSGRTGHHETVRVVYDPSVVSYEELLEVFWKQIDPTDAGGQFADRGSEYETAIFYTSAEERRLAEQSRAEVATMFEEPIATQILPFKSFYAAEEYHQDYYKKFSERYERYKKGSGRADYIEQTWEEEEEEEVAYSRPSDEELRQRLSDVQWEITQEDGTEEPFNNTYWNNTEEGIYVDIVSGAPLFSSKDKYESGTGWPSFTRPLERDNIVLKKDFSLIWPRTEVRSKYGDSHVGHVFNDGPEPTGKRWCMNSAALRFVPAEDLEEEGYGEYAELFEKG